MTEKKLLIDYPELVKEWDYEKNEGLDPLIEKFSGSAHIWWLCNDYAHSWKAVLSNRIKGSGCPYCSGSKILKDFNDLKTLYPDLVDNEWDYELNNKLGFFSDAIGAGSNNSQIMWKCLNYNHSYPASPSSRIRGRKCSYCSNKKVLIGFNDFATTASELLNEWDYEKNILTPQEITAGSDKTVYWICEKQHSYSMSAYRRTGKNPRGCSICTGKVVVKGVNDFNSRYPELSKMWDYERNENTPSEVSYGSSKEVYWIGDKCGHSFKKSPKMLVNSTGCSYCSSTNKKVLSGFNDLETLFPKIAQEWHLEKNGDLRASEITSKAGKQYWWKCSKNEEHEWLSTVHNRTGLRSGCPNCWNTQITSKAELELSEYVKTLGFNPISDRKVLSGKEIDIYIVEKKFAIEFNGLYWHSEKGGKDRKYHYHKWEESKKQGIHLMQVWEDDFLKNPDLIKEMIAYKLGVSVGSKVFARKTVFEKIESNVAKDFLNHNHLQGFYQAANHYGLKDKKSGKIVSVMSVKYFEKKQRLEISRFASKGTVVGGFSKLLNNIAKEEKYSGAIEVWSYSHNDHSNGNVYEQNGFEKVHDGAPGYFYVVSGKREHRLNFTKNKFKEKENLVYVDGKTENELAELNNLNRIWDCGSSLWIKKL